MGGKLEWTLSTEINGLGRGNDHQFSSEVQNDTEYSSILFVHQHGLSLLLYLTPSTL
jgi:hypothetical protein